LCGPAIEAGEGWEPTIPLSAIERIVVEREMELKLCMVKYEVYERAIKRYGWTGRLTDATLSEIKDDI
jgi:hypothetical protein